MIFERENNRSGGSLLLVDELPYFAHVNPPEEGAKGGDVFREDRKDCYAHH